VRPPSAVADATGIRLGLGPNLGQFALLVAVNALVGGMVGQERTVVPLLATEVFGLQALSSALTFIVAFGLTKALTNFAAGALSDRYGRKPVLVAGWVVGLPVPLLLMWAPGWEWVVLANVLLGINQGLTWSTTVIMKIDLVGPARRGLAMGLNEAAGYGAESLLDKVLGVARMVRQALGSPACPRVRSLRPHCSSRPSREISPSLTSDDLVLQRIERLPHEVSVTWMRSAATLSRS
jgi:hypothetical protein